VPADRTPSLLAPDLTGVALDRALDEARAALAGATDARRRDVRMLTDQWQGGHRLEFDDALADVERRARRVAESLDALVLLRHRALDAALAASRGTVVRP
jgi:hypothetical protein